MNEFESSRIIPADAGSTARLEQCSRKTEDHPRECGEHGLKSKFVTNPGGSSPRMRGARARAPSAQPWHGIIPADARSTHIQGEL